MPGSLNKRPRQLCVMDGWTGRTTQLRKAGTLLPEPQTATYMAACSLFSRPWIATETNDQNSHELMDGKGL